MAVALVDQTTRDGDVRHLHAHFAHGTTTVAWLASTIGGLPFSFTGHAKDIYRESLNPGGLLARKLRAATFVATCTSANGRHLRALEPSARVEVVHHGLNADFTELLSSAAPDPDPAPDHLRVVSVGRLVHKKGFDVLVAAVALLRDRGLDLGLTIVGEDGEAGDELRRLVREQGLTSTIELRGPCDQRELLALLGDATVFALACRVTPDGDRDGIPNVLVEAMAAGVPVVSTAISGIPELVRDGENGLLVPPEDPAALADALLRLAKDPGLRDRFRSGGRTTVATEFDGMVCARRMAALFDGAAR